MSVGTERMHSASISHFRHQRVIEVCGAYRTVFPQTPDSAAECTAQPQEMRHEVKAGRQEEAGGKSDSAFVFSSTPWASFAQSVR